MSPKLRNGLPLCKTGTDISVDQTIRLKTHANKNLLVKKALLYTTITIYEYIYFLFTTADKLLQNNVSIITIIVMIEILLRYGMVNVCNIHRFINWLFNRFIK